MRALLLCLALAAAPASAERERLSFVLVTLDAVRADHVGAYGYARAATPELDRLAARGTVFESAFAQAPWTIPSLASLLTGRYTEEHGAHIGRQRLEPGSGTFVRALRDKGWRTGAFLAGVPGAPGFGLSSDFETVRGSWETVPLEKLVDEASAWVREDKAAPFLLWVHGFEAHLPYKCPARWRERFDRGYRGPVHALPIEDDAAESEAWEVEDPKASLIRFVEHYNGDALSRRDQPLYRFDQRYWDSLRRLQARPRDTDHFAAHYDGCLSYMDHQIGRLRRALRKAGVAGRTVWIVTADHGEHLGGREDGGPARISHPIAELSETLLHVPLIVSHPAAAGPRRVAEPVMLVDVGPSILSLAGVAGPPGIRGRDLGLAPGSPAPALARGFVYASDFDFRSQSWARALRRGSRALARAPGRPWSLVDRASPFLAPPPDLLAAEPGPALELGETYLGAVASPRALP